VNVIFLGFVVNKSGVHVDPAKIKVIQGWLVPKNVGDIRSFHGLESFYRRFVLNFSTIASPLNELVKTYLLSGVKDNKRLLMISRLGSPKLSFLLFQTLRKLLS